MRRFGISFVAPVLVLVDFGAIGSPLRFGRWTRAPFGVSIRSRYREGSK